MHMAFETDCVCKSTRICTRYFRKFNTEFLKSSFAVHIFERGSISLPMIRFLKVFIVWKLLNYSRIYAETEKVYKAHGARSIWHLISLCIFSADSQNLAHNVPRLASHENQRERQKPPWKLVPGVNAPPCSAIVAPLILQLDMVRQENVPDYQNQSLAEELPLF